MAGKSFSGGDALDAKLSEIAANLKNGATLSVGFLEDATYDDGTPVAYIAAINEFGATVNREAHMQTVYREVNKSGTGFNKKGRFVKKSTANFASDHAVAAHTITIPARPFFRTMIANKSSEWGLALAGFLKAKKYDAKAALKELGYGIMDQLQESIRGWGSPANAPSTVQKKGFNKPLIDDGTMVRAVNSEVQE